MDNQHKKIEGYRDLSQEEIDLMNKIKKKAAEVKDLVSEIESLTDKDPEGITVYINDPRWSEIARTQLQQGFMALVRSVAKPESF